MAKSVAIVQARTGSTRLPGKVLMPIGGRSVLRWVLDRLGQADKLDQIVVATSVNPGDDVILHQCRQWGVPCFRGSETDVLGRFYEAASAYQADIIVRINSDNPLIDGHYIDILLDTMVADGADYVSYQLRNGRPVMLTALSFFAEAVTRECLNRANLEIADPFQREHVTLGIYKNPERFKVQFLNVPEFCEDAPIRLTVDNQDDFDMLNTVIGSLGDQALEAGAAEIVQLVRSHPEWLERMASLNARNVKSDKK